jgi:hypothetical protein
MGQRTGADRRQSPRYAVKPDVFLVFRPYPQRLGRLIDVGSDGATFEYVAYEHDEGVADVEVDIFTSNPNHFLLRSVPCRVVYDIEIEKPTFNGIKTRRCGLEFAQLTDRQCERLMVLLNHYVSHALPRQPKPSDCP